MSSSVNNLLVKMIRSIELFKNISEEEAIELSKQFELGFYNTGSVIIREGTELNNIYILKNGKLEARKAKGLSYLKFGEVMPGEIFGEMAYMRGGKATATVVAIEDSDIWKIPVEKFDEFLNKYEHIKSEVEELMMKREDENKRKTEMKSSDDEYSEEESESTEDGLKIIL